MADAEQINADMLAYWNGQGGHGWVARQAHTDITFARVTEALLTFAAPRTGARVLDVGCGCGAITLEFARAVGPAGRVVAMDISGPMLAEGRARAKAAGIANVDWQQADPATAELDGYDLLTSAFGVMCFADPERISQVLTAAGWAPPRLEKLDLDLDIAAGHGMEEAVVQSTHIGAVHSWLRNQPAEIVSAAVASLREALAAHMNGASMRLRGAMWLIGSTAA